MNPPMAMELKISSRVPLAPILELVRRYLGRELGLRVPSIDADAGLGRELSDELLRQGDADLGAFLRVFDVGPDAPAAQTGRRHAIRVVHLDEADAEAVIRACTRLRLFLRTDALGIVPDEVLEGDGTGDGVIGFIVARMDPSNPDGVLDRAAAGRLVDAYACYAILAGIQVHVIDLLDTFPDPGAGEAGR